MIKIDTSEIKGETKSTEAGTIVYNPKKSHRKGSKKERGKSWQRS